MERCAQQRAVRSPSAAPQFTSSRRPHRMLRPMVAACSPHRSMPGAAPLAASPRVLRQPRRQGVCRASSEGSKPGQRKEMPIFPLNVVALPTVSIPLMIFEPRYRVLFNTLLDGADGIEEGLVQKESPFAGSRSFGMCYISNRGQLASIGTTLTIQEFVREDDGRMYVIQKGTERFQITKVVKEKPVLICEVEVLAEDDAQDEETTGLAKEVADLFRNTLRLQFKVQRQRREKAGRPAGGAPSPDSIEELLEPEHLSKLSPRELSYWIANSFSEFRPEQQGLLEQDSTRKRLQREKDILGETLKFFSAATALEGVFSSGGSSSSAEGGSSSSSEQKPPSGGPD